MKTRIKISETAFDCSEGYKISLLIKVLKDLTFKGATHFYLKEIIDLVENKEGISARYSIILTTYKIKNDVREQN